MFVIAEEVNYDKLQKYLSYGIRFPYPTMEEAITSNTERITAKIDAELRKQSTRHIRSKLNNVTGTIGDDVTLIDCDIKDSEVNVPSGSVLIDVTIHNSTFNVMADVCKINGSNITDSCCALYANTCLINCLNMTSTCLNMTGSVMFVSGVKLRHNKAYNESSILNVRAADKEILMHNKDICVVGMNTIDNPKIFIDAGSRGYYYTHAQTYCKWHLGKYSITTTDGVIKARVINNGTLLIASRLSGLGLITVGKDSRVDLTRNRLHWYAAQCLEKLVVGDNVVASLNNLKRTTKSVYVKDNFIGYIDKTTGTTRGDFKVVREVHGERPRRSGIR